MVLQHMSISIIGSILFILIININYSESTSLDRQKRIPLIPSTCNLPCVQNGNQCLNGGTCMNGKCDCSNPSLPTCSGISCASVGNKCIFGMGVCTLCQDGKRCHK